MEYTLDKCPGYNLYIGGFINLRRKQAFKNCNITHIVSVLDWSFENDSPLVRGYQHLHIPVDDVEDENLLEWFPRSNAFIQQGLESKSASQGLTGTGSGVFIHCAMGKSRSATILLAYLLWATRRNPNRPTATEDTSEMVSLPPEPLSVVEALELLRQGRAICEPNEGFMEQLHMYAAMGCPTTENELKAHKIYRRWMNKRSVEESLRTLQAPEMEHIKFEDEAEDSDSSDEGVSTKNEKSHMEEVAPGVAAPDGKGITKAMSHISLAQGPQVSVKCRKCRHVLATTAYILNHAPPPHKDPNFDTRPDAQTGETPLPPPQCAHIFLHPLSWMREALSEGKMDGRLGCPNKKCGANIGKFAWTGLRCSCGGWVTPGFALTRARVDENIAQTSAATASNSAGAKPNTPSLSSAIRLPPGMKRQGGNL